MCSTKSPLTSRPSPEVRTLVDAERVHILEALRQVNWVIGGPNGAASRLGLPRTTLVYRMRRLGIKPENSRAIDGSDSLNAGSDSRSSDSDSRSNGASGNNRVTSSQSADVSHRAAFPAPQAFPAWATNV